MTNYYAGIGSRETPDHILKIMHHIGAYLSSVGGWVLRSGGALGADSSFEEGADDGNAPFNNRATNYKEIYLPWRAYNHNLSELNPAKYPFTDQEREFTAKFHPAWNKCGPSARLLHTRNTRIIVGMEAIHGPQVIPVKFVCCWTKGGQVVGGTGQALRIANALDIPIINFGLATNPSELEYLVKKVNTYVDKFKKTSN